MILPYHFSLLCLLTGLSSASPTIPSPDKEFGRAYHLERRWDMPDVADWPISKCIAGFVENAVDFLELDEDNGHQSGKRAPKGPNQNQYIIAPAEDEALHKKSIFLAGTTERNWRGKLSDALANVPVTLYDPSRDDWQNVAPESAGNPPFNKQVKWELAKQEAADIVVVYFLPGVPSPISLLELGIWAKSGKLLVVCPEGYKKKGNVDVVSEVYKFEMVDDAGLEAAIRRRLSLPGGPPEPPAPEPPALEPPAPAPPAPAPGPPTPPPPGALGIEVCRQKFFKDCAKFTAVEGKCLVIPLDWKDDVSSARALTPGTHCDVSRKVDRGKCTDIGLGGIDSTGYFGLKSSYNKYPCVPFDAAIAGFVCYRGT